MRIFQAKQHYHLRLGKNISVMTHNSYMPLRSTNIDLCRQRDLVLCSEEQQVLVKINSCSIQILVISMESPTTAVVLATSSSLFSSSSLSHRGKVQAINPDCSKFKLNVKSKIMCLSKLGKEHKVKWMKTNSLTNYHMFWILLKIVIKFKVSTTNRSSSSSNPWKC